MKLGAVIKLNKRKKTVSKKFNDDVMAAICDVIVIFQFMSILEQSGTRIPDA